MKYGLECEFFVAKQGTPETVKSVFEKETGFILIGGLPNQLTPDECGFLAEARGSAENGIRDAVFSLKADIYRLQQEAKKLSLTLIKEPLLDVRREEIIKSRRAFSKGVISYQNMYGYGEHRNKNKKTAGIHISFTSPKSVYGVDGKLVSVENVMFDFIQIVRKLDAAFAAEIKSAGRFPGFYELKGDGRIEYRSLPNNVDLYKIIEVLS